MARINYTEAQLKALGLSYTEAGQQVSGEQTTSPKANKIGAKRVELDGNAGHAASKLEAYAYNLLKAAKIEFVFQWPFTLQESFIYRGKKIQPLVIIIDFWIPSHDILMDTKGRLFYHTEIKLKLLKHQRKQLGFEPRIELPRTKDEVDKIISEILTP